MRPHPDFHARHPRLIRFGVVAASLLGWFLIGYAAGIFAVGLMGGR